MEIVNVPQEYKAKLEGILANREINGEYITGLIEQALSEATNYEEFYDMLFNDFESHINDFRRIEKLLK